MNFKIIFFFIFTIILYSQISKNENKKNYHYILNDIVITGTKKYNKNQILNFMGLQLNEVINISPRQSSCIIQKIWNTNLFSDINIFIKSIKNNSIILEINLTTLKTLDNITIHGISKNEIQKLKKNFKIEKGITINENLKQNIIQYINKIYYDKGFYNNKINFIEIKNKQNPSKINWIIISNKGNSIKIKKILFTGNHFLSKEQLTSIIKYTKKKKIFKFITYPIFNEKNFENDLKLIINKYQNLGFKEIKIKNYLIKNINKQYYNIIIQITEGKRYYIGKIKFIGNQHYSEKLLNEIFEYKTGDIYKKEEILKKIYKSEIGDDILTSYKNNGYLFSNIDLIETPSENDSIINITLLINEGKKAKWNKINFSGNHSTYDYVIQRSLETLPGDVFSKDDIQRTYFNLSNLPFIEIEDVKQNIIPNPKNNTVDIHWNIKEKSASQFQLQGGYGAKNLIGTFGISIGNFSLKNVLNKKKWSPFPIGEGQTLAFQAQSGLNFKNYSLKFIGPWITNKPTNLLFEMYSTILANRKKNINTKDNIERLHIFRSTIGLKKILPFLDNLLYLSQSVNSQIYKFSNYLLCSNQIEQNNNLYYDLYYNIILGRDSQGPDTFFPTYGSSFNISLKFNPPYFIFNNINYSNNYDQKKHKYIELYKLKMNTYWYKTVFDKFIIKTGAEFGTLECYNKQLGVPIFERFFIGGSGLLHHKFDNRETITLRGYEESSETGGMTEKDITTFGGGLIYNKFMIEIRYPLSIQKSKKIYILSFIEAANTWKKWKNYKPFILNRSAGLGIRILLPVLGVIGIDLGYGFDKLIGSNENYGWKTHFTFGNNF